MTDDSTEEILRLRFRADILRGVRLFAIVFAAILVCVAAYRVFKAPADVLGSPPESAAADPAQPTAAPVSEAAPEVHPLVVPEPPPVAGTVPVTEVRSRVNRPRNLEVPPPPPIAPAAARRRAPQPAGREFESTDTVVFPDTPVEEPAESKPPTPKQAVGYKSLIEANRNRPPVEAAPPPAEDSSEAPAKGNRFFRAIGKIFHPGAKKEAEPAELQPKQQ